MGGSNGDDAFILAPVRFTIAFQTLLECAKRDCFRDIGLLDVGLYKLHKRMLLCIPISKSRKDIRTDEPLFL